MFCNSCGSEIKEGQAFCSNCGAPAPVSQPIQQAQPAVQPVQQPVQQPVVQQPVQQPVQPQPAKPAPNKKKGNVLSFISLGILLGTFLICSGIVAVFGLDDTSEVFAVYALLLAVALTASMVMAVIAKIRYKSTFGLVMIIISAILSVCWVLGIILFMIIETGNCVTDCVHHF